MSLYSPKIIQQLIQLINCVNCMSNHFEVDPTSLNLINQQLEEGENSPFSKLRKISINSGNELFEDDQFKLPQQNLPKGVVITRLSKIYTPKSSISQSASKNQRQQKMSTQGIVHHHPTYLPQLKMIPDWHYQTLIEPKIINQKGYYYVAVVQDGRATKILVDDYVYYDQIAEHIYCHPLMENRPVWVHIILKAWAKINRGYEQLYNCEPFSFVQAFTYPDWSIFNPGLESLQTIISKIGNKNQKEHFYVAKTKSDKNVGLYGLIPGCASYVISGYYQEYENIFLKIKSFVGDKWNGCSQDQDIEMPSDPIHLDADEFIIPLKIFISLFHLIYFTTKKYNKKQPLFYNQYTVRLDARESKASFIEFEVQGENGILDKSVSINFYFPSVKPSDFCNPNPTPNRKSLAPSCKISIGRSLQKLNQQGSMSYAESLKQFILKNEQSYLLKQVSEKYQYIVSDYFKGYANQTTYHLKLKPGRYIIRLKIQKLLPQYRGIINFISNQEINVSQLKINKKQQIQFLSEVLSNKARKQQRNIIYPYPHKKQMWIMTNHDFQIFGYGSIIFQTGRNDTYAMVITIDALKIKRGGYRLKNKIQLIAHQRQIRLQQGDSMIIILKKDLDYKGTQRKWPPQGIYVSYQSIQSSK